MINVKQLLSAWNCIQLVHIKENLIHSSKWSLWYIWGKWLRWLYYDKIEPEAFYPFVCWFYALSLYCGSMLFDCIVAGLWIMAARRRQLHPTPVLLPGKSHGQRSLVGCSPWGRKELDMTERLHFHFSLSCVGEGNGHPLQCSCLENPRDGGAWWAAVYGVAQGRTRLKRLSSSSMQFYGTLLT